MLAPLASIAEPWQMVGLIFLPNIQTRAELDCLQLQPELVRFILTAEQLGDDDWLAGLGLGTAAASAADYSRLGAVFVGSEYVGYCSQEVDHQKEAEKRVAKSLKRIGAPNENPQGAQCLEAAVNFSDLEGRILSSIPNIIYYNPEQKTILSSPQDYLVYAGDYGTGKTYMLMAAARRAAEDKSVKVLFCTASQWDKMLQIKLKKQFQGSDVEVLSLASLMTSMGTMNSQKKGEKKSVACFLDEVPLTKADKKAAKAGTGSSELVSLLNTLHAGSGRAWVSIRSGDMADSVPGADPPPVTSEEVQTYLEEKTAYKMVTLTKRVRNTALVAATAPADVTKHYNGDTDYSSSVTGYSAATVVGVATSHTVPGDRPVAVLADIGNIHRRVIIGIYSTGDRGVG